ncbi:exodeoxyribonuclease VII large subunit [Actinomycetes bacterium M1A6_2h]
MNNTEDGVNAHTIDAMHAANEHSLRQKSVDPVSAMEGAAGMMAARRIAVRGECRNRQKFWGGLNFDLASLDEYGNVTVLPTRITQAHYTKISGFLASQHGVDLAAHIGECHEVTVDGFLALDMMSGSLYLDARRVGPATSPRGNVALANDAARKRLAEIGVPVTRLDTDNPHQLKNGTTALPWPDPVKSLALITTPKSQGAEDFLRQLPKSELDVKRINISMRGPTAASALIDAVHEAQAKSVSMIVIVRGGGKWSDLHVFDRVDVAECLFLSTTPVFTATGHSGDVSLADRAAAASFDTPTAAGSAISSRMRALRSQKYAERDAAMTSARQARQQSVAKAHLEVLESKNREVMALKAQLSSATSECSQWMQLWHIQAYRAGLLRVRLRSLVLALVATSVCCATTTALITGLVTENWWWLLVAASSVGGVYTFLGPRRALAIPKNFGMTPPITWQDWCASAECVSAPRHFRRLWFEGRPANRVPQ